MKAELEARIAQLEADLQAQRDKLEQLVQTIPEELHSMTREMFDRIKAFFE